MLGEVLVSLTEAIVSVIQRGNVLLLGRNHRVLLVLHGEQLPQEILQLFRLQSVFGVLNLRDLAVNL